MTLQVEIRGVAAADAAINGTESEKCSSKRPNRPPRTHGKVAVPLVGGGALSWRGLSRKGALAC